ncbi:MAG: type II/IV secretion system protein [Chloroflexi bacterium]|nr:MAG: type II/IV secretion system protein [Chloroflexota bacterium]
MWDRKRAVVLKASGTAADAGAAPASLNGGDQNPSTADGSALAGHDRRPLGELLVERGAVSAKVLEQNLRRQRKDPRPLGELLVEEGLLEPDLLVALGTQLGLTPIHLDETQIDDDVLRLIDGVFARQHRVVPLGVDDGGRLHLATPTPNDPALRQGVAERTQREVVLQLAGREAVERVIDRRYTVLTRVDAAAQRAVGDRMVTTPASASIPLRADAPVVEIVNLLLLQGLRDRASDIHIEPQADRARVRFRIDGALYDVQTLPRELMGPIASRVKILADMDIVDRHRSQDGQLTTTLDGRPIDVRVSTMETVWGEKTVMRLLDRSRSLMPLAQLGLRKTEHDRLRNIIASPFGLLVAAGPTGAGKTTTLYAALNELDRTSKNITTIEDPVEYHFPDINQVQINRLAGTTFANGLKAILRQDPDVILVGEVRDAETALIAVQSALTGHLVLCSLHAGDAVGAVHRFIDMGIEPFLVASALVGVVAQRLVRTVCERCTVRGLPRPQELEFYRAVMDRLPAADVATAVGCPRCSNTGFYGRVGVFECLQVDDTMRELIVARAHHSELRELATDNGMRTLQQAGCEVADSGRTTLTEVMRTVYTI